MRLHSKSYEPPRSSRWTASSSTLSAEKHSASQPSNASIFPGRRPNATEPMQSLMVYAQKENYTRRAHSKVITKGIEASQDAVLLRVSAADFKLFVLNTSWKLIFVEFEQFVSLTSGTTLGSAKVMSTHYVKQFSDRELSTRVRHHQHCTRPHHAALSR